MFPLLISIERSDFFTPGKSRLKSNDLSVSAISTFGVNSFLKLFLKNSESLKKSSNKLSDQKDDKCYLKVLILILS